MSAPWPFTVRFHAAVPFTARFPAQMRGFFPSCLGKTFTPSWPFTAKFHATSMSLCVASLLRPLFAPHASAAGCTEVLPADVPKNGAGDARGEIGKQERRSERNKKYISFES